ncbi:MAG: hypothetical protein K8U57_15085 [Planctomycetes bacterium]|nr:hypothetical protein [Planctomycetota bacterium]
MVWEFLPREAPSEILLGRVALVGIFALQFVFYYVVGRMLPDAVPSARTNVECGGRFAHKITLRFGQRGDRGGCHIRLANRRHRTADHHGPSGVRRSRRYRL